LHTNKRLQKGEKWGEGVKHNALMKPVTCQFSTSRVLRVFISYVTVHVNYMKLYETIWNYMKLYETIWFSTSRLLRLLQLLFYVAVYVFISYKYFQSYNRGKSQLFLNRMNSSKTIVSAYTSHLNIRFGIWESLPRPILCELFYRLKLF